MSHTLTAEDLAPSRTLTQAHGTSYYLASYFFPGELRDAVFGLYGFVRKADDIVDVEEADPEQAQVKLDALCVEWGKAYADGGHEEPVLNACAWALTSNHVPRHYMDEFLDAMRQDTHKARYASYEELRQYMYGSAAVIGRMLTHLIGYADPAAFRYADSLGYAMQLTNFLRDIREDLEERDRIYMPLEEMKQFGVTEAMLREHQITPEFKTFLAFQVDRARSLYADSDAGISMLNPQGRRAVRAARYLYSGILDQIERNGYDVFARRLYTSKAQKVKLLAQALFKR